MTEWRDKRRRYFQLLHKKRSDFWTARIEAQQSQPQRLWESFDALLGRSRTPPPTDILGLIYMTSLTPKSLEFVRRLLMPNRQHFPHLLVAVSHELLGERAIGIGQFLFVRSTRNQLLQYLENRLT